MNYFPVFMDIRDREILICGGGKHAMEKIEKLKPFQPKLHVISENLSEDFRAYLSELMADAYGNSSGGLDTDVCRGSSSGLAPKIWIEKKRLSENDLSSCPVLVIAAENPEENRRIAALCREKHIPVNAVDQPEDCDFIFPSMLVTEHLCIGISTGGVSPTGAICLRNRFAEAIPDDVDEILLWIRSLKEELKKTQMEKSKLNKILRLAMNEALTRGRVLTKAELGQLCSLPSSLPSES